MWRRGDVGLGDAGCGDFGTRRRMGIRGRDKQIAPDFCAELVKYFFLGVKCGMVWYAGEFVGPVAGDFRRTWFLLAYFTERALLAE